MPSEMYLAAIDSRLIDYSAHYMFIHFGQRQNLKLCQVTGRFSFHKSSIFKFEYVYLLSFGLSEY